PPDRTSDRRRKPWHPRQRHHQRTQHADNRRTQRTRRARGENRQRPHPRDRRHRLPIAGRNAAALAIRRTGGRRRAACGDALLHQAATARPRSLFRGSVLETENTRDGLSHPRPRRGIDGCRHLRCRQGEMPQPRRRQTRLHRSRLRHRSPRHHGPRFQDLRRPRRTVLPDDGHRRGRHDERRRQSRSPAGRRDAHSRRGGRSRQGPRASFRAVRNLQGDLLRHQSHPAQIHDEEARPHRTQRTPRAHDRGLRSVGAPPRRRTEENRPRMTVHERKWDFNGTHRVPYWVYTDAEIYAREMKDVFARSWNYVGLEAEIPNPGDFKRTHAGETSVIVVRGKEGEINVLKNQCAHRGLEVCRQDYGTARVFQCPYHQWTYRLDGDLSGVPFMKGVDGHGGMPDDFDRKDHGLKKLKVATRHGAMFATEAEDIEPLETYLGDKMLKLFDRVFNGKPLRILGVSRQRIPANWKLMFENIKDPYHASLLHVFLVTFGLFRADN